jgi:hypothetical protein
MSDSGPNLDNFNLAITAWKKRNPNSVLSEVFKLHEFLGALSCYCPAKDWDRALSTTFGYIKPVSRALGKEAQP